MEISCSKILHNLKKSRLLRKKTQQDVADFIGVSKDAYRKNETGQSPISLNRLIQVCQFLDLDLRDLLDEHLTSKQIWEYDVEIKRLQQGVEELKVERERLWNTVNSLLRISDPRYKEEALSLIR